MYNEDEYYHYLLHRTTTNYLLLNLAVADIVTGTFLTPEYILRYIKIHLNGSTGTILCKLLVSGWVGCASSVFTLVSIAIERYYAVLHPNKSKVTKRKLKVCTMRMESY